MDRIQFAYSPEDLAYILSIEKEASTLFHVGKVYQTREQLRDEVKAFADTKGFAVTTDGNKILCTRCSESPGQKRRREKKIAAAIVPANKRRIYRSSTRCGCPFQIAFSWIHSNTDEKPSRVLKINKSSNYIHDNSCLPCRAQLVAEKRKSGAYSKAIHESELKCILLLLSTNNKISAGIMRDLLQPLFPPDHCLDAQLLFNFRLKARRLLDSKPGGVCHMTLTREDETSLLNSDSLDTQYPSYYTDAFRLFNELIHEALQDENDIAQIETYLNGLAACDSSFKWKRANDSGGRATGYMWQTGVHRKDVELYGSTLFIDRLGRPLNNKGWPLLTIAMLSGEKKVCVACEAIVISERVDAYAWLIQSFVDLTPGFDLKDIKVIYADGFHAGETLLDKLGIKGNCNIVLDHMHLLNADIGAWPKFFGLASWATLLTTMLLLAIASSPRLKHGERGSKVGKRRCWLLVNGAWSYTHWQQPMPPN
jgi:hypothetical protein